MRIAPTRMLLVLALLNACSGSPTNSNSKQQAATSTTTSATETLVPKAETPAFAAVLTKGPCPASSEEFAPIVVAILTAAISSFVPTLFEGASDQVQNWLNNGADELNASTTAIADWPLWVPQRETYVAPAKCLLFVRGDFSKLGATATPADVKGVWTAADTSALNARLRKEGYPEQLQGNPELYMEYKIDYDTVELTGPNFPKGVDRVDVPLDIKLRPVKVVYLKSGARRGSTKSKKLVAEVKLTADVLQGNSRAQMVLFDQPFDFGQVSIGQAIDIGKLALQPTAHAAMVYPFAISVPASLTKKAAQVYDPVHVTSSVIVTESESGGDIERAFAKGISSSTPGMEKAIENALTNAITPKPKPNATPKK
jgi:hypothetical protein